MLANQIKNIFYGFIMWGKRPQSDTKIKYIYITYKIINNLQIHKQTNKFIYNYLKKNTDQSESSISKYHDQI